MAQLKEAQKTAIFTYIEEHLEDLIKDLIDLIRFPSVKAPPQGAMPFGRPMQECLDAALAISRRLGFQTKDLDGFVGVAEAGEGAECLGILCHLDVVPAGPGWSTPPFGGERKAGRIYGRGTADDKGPAVCALYALSAVLASEVPLSRRVRVILGCDEESGWDCIERYKKTEEAPTMAFSPDGTYPLVYSERGIFQTEFNGGPLGRVRIDCGERANVVPGTASVFVPLGVSAADCPKAEGITVECAAEGAGTRITVSGLGAHASTPEEGRSALLYTLALLAALPLSDADGAGVFKGLHSAFQGYYHGEGFDLDAADESGRLTLSPGVLALTETGLRLVIDIRHPLSLSPDGVLAKLNGVLCPLGLTLHHSHSQPGHAVSRESALVKTLMAVYQAETGDLASEPEAIGGGTYARAFENAVAFGCEFPGQPMIAHMPDEYMTIEDILQNTRMMALAIAQLAGE